MEHEEDSIMREDGSIRHPVTAYNTNMSIPSALQGQVNETGRGSTRFSKGYHDEMDKVADRINRSFTLNPDGTDENDSIGMTDEVMEKLPPRPIRASQDSALLPRHARSVSK